MKFYTISNFKFWILDEYTTLTLKINMHTKKNACFLFVTSEHFFNLEY